MMFYDNKLCLLLTTWKEASIMTTLKTEKRERKKEIMS